MVDAKQLPLDLLELQIGQLDLLMAMYPEDVLIGGHEMKLLDALRSAIESGSSSDVNAAQVINMVLRLPVVDEGASAAQTLQLDLTAPFTYEGPKAPKSRHTSTSESNNHHGSAERPQVNSRIPC